jgi:uncharacterized repeat protein (TIGR02543 family)
MSKKKLAGIIIACIIAIIVVIVLVIPPLLKTPTHTLNVSVSPSGAGSVSPSGGEYKSGVQVTLTASPASGYTFDYWSGGASGTTSTITVTMDSDKSLTANFKATSQTYTLTTSISPSGAGSVSPSGGEYESGVQVTLTASPASSYTFDYWEGSASGTSPTVTITMNSDKSLIAHFKTIPQVPQTSRTNPAGLHQTVRLDVDDWLDGKVVLELEMLELISGSRAWNMIYAWNMYNDHPGAGKEYILAKFRVKIVELEKEPYDINHAQFDVYSTTGVMYTEFFSVAGMDPDLRTNLYEGAEHIGYTAFLVRTDDSPVAVYMARWDENAWFDLRAGS